MQSPLQTLTARVTFTLGLLSVLAVISHAQPFSHIQPPFAALRPSGANTITATAEDISGNTAAATITVSGSATPVGPAQLAANPIGGFVPLQVTLTPQSAVPGTLQQVLYDFNGDGITDLTRTDLNAVTHSYSSAGEYFPVVTIVTSDGRFSSPGGWNGGLDRIRVNAQAPPQQIGSSISIIDPVDLKATPNGHLYVLSRSTATIVQFDASYASVRSLSGIGSAPQGMDVDSSGNVYVALAGNHQVKKLRPLTGSFEPDPTFGDAGRIGKADGSSGTGDGEFNAPYDVAVAPDGNQFAVSDSANHRIQRFTKDGAFIGAFGQQGSGTGQYNTPRGLTYDSEGYLYIVDSGNKRVVLTLSSGLIGTSGTAGTALGQFQGALNIAAASRGIYAADAGNNRVQCFDPISGGDGLTPTPFNPRLALGSGLGLNQPNAVAAVADLLEEKAYLADTGNNRVLLVTLPSESPVTVWEAMKDHLLNGDIVGAIPYFSSETAEDYREVFLTIGTPDIIPITTTIPALLPVVIESGRAQYRFEQVIEEITI